MGKQSTQSELLTAAKRGDAAGQFELAMAYFEGNGMEEDLDRGWEWLLKSAQRGYPGAQFRAGLFYEHGHGVEEDLDLATQWLERAAKQGHAQSIRELGFLYFSDTAKKDRKKAAAWFRKAVVAMTRDARRGLRYRGNLLTPQHELALAYFEGDPLVGGKPDHKKAAQWAEMLRKSANQRERSEGNLILGQLSLNGWGRPKDIPKGLQLLEASAEDGSLEAKELLENRK